MSLTDIQTIKQTDCVGDSRITINNNFQTLVDEISATQKHTVLATPKGTRGTIIIGDGLSVNVLGVLALDFNTSHFQYNANRQLCLSDTILNNTFIKPTGGTITGGLSVTGNGSVGINTTASTTYKLDVNGPARFKGTTVLPSHPGGALTYIDVGTGDGATYSLYNTVIYVGKGLAIKSSSGAVNIVLNSSSGDIITRGTVHATNIKSPNIIGDTNTESGDILINKCLVVTSVGTINLSGETTSSSPLLSSDNSTRVATTRFVQTNLNTVKETLNDVPLLYLKKDENASLAGYITTIPPLLPGHIANKQYVDAEIGKVSDLGDRLSVLTTLANFLTLKIDTQPVGVRINEGAVASLSARAIPDNVEFMPINYQWKRNGVNVVGANSSTYNATTSGIYTCLCTNMVSQTATSAAQVDMNYRVLLADRTPASTNLTSTLQTRVLTVVVQAGTPPFTYRWYKNNTIINGAITNQYAATTGGRYRCLVSNTVNEAYSDTSIVGTEINIKVVSLINRTVQVYINSVFYSAYSVNIDGQIRTINNNTTVTFTDRAVGVNTLLVTSPDSLAAVINITVPSPEGSTNTIDENIILIPTA